MSNPMDTMLSLEDVRKALARHWRKSVSVFALLLIAVFAGLAVWPRAYESEGKLFVTLGRQSVALDPTATTGQIVSISESRDIEINSIIEMLSSRAMIEKVVDQIGPGAINDSEDSREAAIARMLNNISVSAPKRSTVVSVSCNAATPGLAQNIVATLMNEYLEEHVRVHRTAGSHEFFLEQSKILERELERANQELRDTKNEVGIVSIAGKRATLEKQIATIEQQINSTETQLSASRAKINSLNEKIVALPERIVTQNVAGFPGVGADNMQNQLFQLQIQERELLSKYTEAHPLVAAIRQQVEQAEKLHAKTKPVREQATTTVNPARQQLEIALLNEQAGIESLMGQGEKLAEQKARAYEELRALNHAAVRIEEQQQAVDLAKASYRAYADKLELARIDQAMQGDRISNVNIMQPASFVSKPVSPQKALILFAGFVLAVLGAYGTAMVAELFDRSLKSGDEVERQLDLPVLVSIPRTSRHAITTDQR